MSSSNSDRRRIVITGLGIVSPIGIGVEAFRDNLRSGQSGIRVVGAEASAAPGHVGADVPGFSSDITKEVMPKKQRKFARVMCREIELGVVAALTAIEQAHLNLEEINHERFGVDFGANLMFSPPEVLKDACWSVTEKTGNDEVQFEYDRWGDEGMQVLEPLWLLKYLPNMPACHIGIATEARGPNNSITLDDASGNLAIGEAARIIERDRADVMIAGTTGTKLNAVKTMHAALWKDLADGGDASPEKWSRPFGEGSSGQVVAEGACALVLETAEHAEQRGAELLGEVLGLGSSCVTDSEGRANIQQALEQAMEAALADAGIAAEDVGHVNANGIGVLEVDRSEAAAIQKIFPKGVPVTAIKSYMGNSGAGAGVQEIAASLLGLKEGWIPKTLNFESLDGDCAVDLVVGEHRPTSNKIFINLNVTRSGQASALVVRGV